MTNPRSLATKSRSRGVKRSPESFDRGVKEGILGAIKGDTVSLVRCLLFVLLLPSTVAVALAAAPVWKVSKGSNYLYIGGTVHILSETDYPLPSAFELAWDDSEILAVEVDLERYSDDRLWERRRDRFVYPENEGLEDEISEATLLELSRYCVMRDISLRWITRFRPGAVAGIIGSYELQRLAMTGTGVDAHFEERARAEGRTILFLDSVQTQFQLVLSLNNEDPDVVVRSAVDSAFEVPEWLRNAKDAWREGDLQTLKRVAVDPRAEKYPHEHYYLLVERNRDWIPKIERMLRDEPVEMVLFGAAHLVGDYGVLDLLRNKGYQLEQLY